jgi:hypothetical protein
MWRNQVLCLTGVLFLAIAGCSSEESPPPQTTAASPTPTLASPTPITPANPKAGANPNQPVEVQRQTVPAVPGLIPSTNSQERGKQVSTEIRTGKPSDPFANLPPVLPQPTNQAVPNVTKLPAGSQPGASTPREPAEAESPTIPKNQGAPLGVKLPPILPPPSVIAGPTGTRSGPLPLPPPPSTDTAKAVEVTGVIVVGNSPQAIVVAPGDATSRYVSAGQRVSGGRVLVKRIEFPTGSEPVVILEENGVEVAKAVGEKAPQAAKPPA